MLFLHLSPKGDPAPPPENIYMFRPIEKSWTAASGLVVPISYTLDVTKQPTQFVQDVKTVLEILGVSVPVAAPAAAPAVTDPKEIGYWGEADFESKFTTSSIKITPSSSPATVPPEASVIPPKSKDNTTPAGSALTPITYTNEAPTHYGLSIAVPVSHYKDVTYQSTGGMLVPSTVTKQNAFVAFDGYYPAAIPGLMTFRYIPHPFVALPLAGKVFQHPMVGLSFGFPWFEAYAGALFDRGNSSTNGSPKNSTQWSFGVKISVSAAASALKSASSK